LEGVKTNLKILGLEGRNKSQIFFAVLGFHNNGIARVSIGVIKILLFKPDPLYS